MKDYHVFISYSRDDDPDFANSQSPISQILNRFEKARLKPWIDREGKYIGENYLREIVKGIDNSEMMLFVSSKNSNNSYYALKEVCYAADNKMKILPLLLDDSPFNEEIKLLFSAKDKRWFHPNTSKTLEELTGSIKKYIDDIAQKEREKAEAEEAERRRIEAENERKRVEAEEKIRIAKLEKENQTEEEESYNVFISCKSEDYDFAQPIHDFLIANGLKVFFADAELKEKAESQYADVIDEALDATKHLIVVATSIGHIKSKWVKYEWSTFSNDLKSNYRDGNLITILSPDITPRMLPASLRHMQSFSIENFENILPYVKK